MECIHSCTHLASNSFLLFEMERFFDEIAMSLDSCMIGLRHLIDKNLSLQRKEFAPGRVNSLLEELTLHFEERHNNSLLEELTLHFEERHNENGSLLKGYLLPLSWEGSLG